MLRHNQNRRPRIAPTALKRTAVLAARATATSSESTLAGYFVEDSRVPPVSSFAAKSASFGDAHVDFLTTKEICLGVTTTIGSGAVLDGERTMLSIEDHEGPASASIVVEGSASAGRVTIDNMQESARLKSALIAVRLNEDKGKLVVLLQMAGNKCGNLTAPHVEVHSDQGGFDIVINNQGLGDPIELASDTIEVHYSVARITNR